MHSVKGYDMQLKLPLFPWTQHGLGRAYRKSCLDLEVYILVLYPTEKLQQFVGQPTALWIFCNIKMIHSSAIMAQYNKHKQHLETNRRHNQKIDRCHICHMIAYKSLPSLRWRLPVVSLNDPRH